METIQKGKGFRYDELVEGTPTNLKGLFRDLVNEIKRQKKENCGLTNPLRPIECKLTPKFWSRSGLDSKYYDQMIAIYNTVLKVVDSARGKFYSSRIAEFENNIGMKIVSCERLKQEYQKERSFWKEFRENRDKLWDIVLSGKLGNRSYL